jgi:hypothetical protein
MEWSQRSKEFSQKEEKRGEVQLEVATAREYRYCHYTIQSHQPPHCCETMYYKYTTTEIKYNPYIATA